MRAATTPLADPPPEPPGFDAVYRAHVGFVWRTLRRFGIADAELEDAAHEVFLIVHRKLAGFDGRSAVTTWLFAIARGVASNRRRGELRRLRRHEGLPEPAPPDDPSEHVARAQAAAAVARFLAGLGEDQRLAFELVEIEGLKAAEVAELLDLNVNTVFTRLRAARLRFRDYVAALGGRGGDGHV